MNRCLKRSLYIFSWPILIASAYYLYSYNVRHQSPSSLRMLRFTQLTGIKQLQAWASQRQDLVVDLLSQRKNDLPLNPDWRVHHISDKYFVEDMPVYVWNDHGLAGQKTIFYLHGGGYIVDATPFHFDFIRDIITRTDARLVFPVFYKTPKYSYQQAFPLVYRLYQEWAAKGPMYLMGDSAGGGFALSLAISLKQAKAELARHIFLISPWLDLSLEDKAYKHFDSLDPLLDLPALQLMGRFWAGKTYSVKDWQISPIYGDLSGLPPIFVSVGTHELLYWDSFRLRQAIQASHGQIETYLGQRMNHIFPILPIYEARPVRQRIVNLMNQESEE
ncbi:Acetyl esterase/lipase [Ignavigranum ruoffiae]|uniref:Acetyl esterase/lipase n=1 Tax=Ignavigranum ruoffiae TaxID=89093 RepID=A0A1H9F7H0_9LACT|nr:alpha/beta hydrolase [Ignavigranum ruoffiae]SEQ33797.1 Acetyl esterase/lipase [Ignavigranum ruoffiae]